MSIPSESSAKKAHLADSKQEKHSSNPVQTPVAYQGRELRKLDRTTDSKEDRIPLLTPSQPSIGYQSHKLLGLDRSSDRAEITPYFRGELLPSSRRKTEMKMVVSSDPSAYMNKVKCPGVPETFFVSELPYSREAYWSLINEQAITVGVSLDDPSFFLVSKDRPEYRSGEFLITLIDETRNLDIQHQQLQITHMPTHSSRRFDHLSLDWEDMGLPAETSFNQFMTLYLSLVKESPKPRTHLHCIGGHGRSGTFLLTRALLAQPEPTVAEEMLATLRKQRSQLVEKKKQFLFAVTQASLLSGKEHIAGTYTNDFIDHRRSRPGPL